MSKSQKELLREHLKAGKTITRPQAEKWYGIGRISARISELRNDDGYNIGAKEVVVEKAVGGHATIAVYYDPEYVDEDKIGPEAAIRNGTPVFDRYRKEPEKEGKKAANETDNPPDDDLPSGDVAESFKKNFKKNQGKTMVKQQEDKDTGAEYVEFECDNNSEVRDKLLRAYSECKVMDKNTRVQPLAGQSWLKINKSMYVSINRNTGKVIVAAKSDVVNKPTFDFTAGKITEYFREYKPEVQLIDQTTGFDIPKISGSTLMHYCEIQLNKQ